MRWLFLILSTALLSGCGYNVQYSPLNNPLSADEAAIANGVAARGPVQASDVTLFLVQRPEKRYRELGIITIPTGQSLPNQEEIFQLFRQKAAEVGADGVIIMDTQTAIETYPTATYVYDWGLFYQDTIRSRSIFRGMAIQFLE